MEPPPDSVVVVHDRSAALLAAAPGGRLAAFRHDLPAAFDLDDPAYDWEDVFAFLPDELLAPAWEARVLAHLPAGWDGRAARVFCFGIDFPTGLANPHPELGRLERVRLDDVDALARECRLADAETLLALYALARRYGRRPRD